MIILMPSTQLFVHLALGLKLIHETDIGRTNAPSKIFYGTCGNIRYSQWLKSMLERINNLEQSLLNCYPRDFGTHSFRKGAATYVCGLMNSPDNDSTKLRMDHSIIPTDDHYINSQEGSDRHVGRCLNIKDDDFCYLPPVFVTFDDVNFADVLPAGRLKKASPYLRQTIPFLHPPC